MNHCRSFDDSLPVAASNANVTCRHCCSCSVTAALQPVPSLATTYSKHCKVEHGTRRSKSQSLHT